MLSHLYSMQTEHAFGVLKRLHNEEVACDLCFLTVHFVIAASVFVCVCLVNCSTALEALANWGKGQSEDKQAVRATHLITIDQWQAHKLARSTRGKSLAPLLYDLPGLRLLPLPGVCLGCGLYECTLRSIQMQVWATQQLACEICGPLTLLFLQVRCARESSKNSLHYWWYLMDEGTLCCSVTLGI